MSDFQKYKKKRMKEDPEFWDGYEERLETFKLGILLKQARGSENGSAQDISRFDESFQINKHCVQALIRDVGARRAVPGQWRTH